VTAPTPLRQCWELAGKDLRLELRAGEALLVTTPFGAVALLLVPLSVGADTPLLRQLGPGMYWTVVLLFGVLVTLRQTTAESGPQSDLLRMCGIDPVIGLTGRAGANTLALLAFEVLLAPVAVVLYDPDLSGWPWLLPVFPLVAIGLAVLGTLAGALAHGLAGRTTLGPLLVVPVALPLLLGATEILRLAGYGAAPWPWLLLVFTVDVIAALAVLLCARHLEELA
jgi:heme exporter protein B